jgi:hypothetical protein
VVVITLAVVVVLGVVASVVVVGGTGPAAGQKSGEGAP